MKAAFTGTSTEIAEITSRAACSAAVNLVLAALDPGPFGQVTEPPWTVRRSTLFEAERKLEEALAIFEHLDEAGLRDNTNGLIDQVLERLAVDQEEAA